MNDYDTSDTEYRKDVEEEVDRIREKALRIVRQTRPDIEYVYDRRSIYDYCERQWDYPGKWYAYFTLPANFKNEDELVLTIVSDTIEYFSKGGDKKEANQSGNKRAYETILSKIKRSFNKKR